MSDDLDDEDLGLDGESFDEFENKNQTLGDLWRNNSAVKVGVVVVAAVVIFSVVAMMGGEKEVAGVSVLPPGSDVSAPPGTQETNPAYIAAIEEENETRHDQAIRQGSSVLPTPINPPEDLLTVPQESAQEEDPLQQWRQLQEKRLEEERKRQASYTQAVPVQDTAQTEAIQALSDAMSQQMQSVLESRGQVAVQSKTVTGPGFLSAKEAEEAAQISTPDDGQGEPLETVLVPAGDIAYAQLMIEANSDIPGPVLAQIVSGPLSGSRILGSFSQEEELLVLNFNTVVVDGTSISISAIAVDPDTTLTAMATDVDHRYFKRIVLPAAAAFIEGMASAIAESGRTTVTVTGETVATETEDTNNDQEVATGIEEAGAEVRSILDEQADVEILVRVEAGTPMGILFLEPVLQTENGT